MDAEVIIVGAGVAGLVAADELVRHGHDALVLEARDRVGGRTLNGLIPGTDAVVELGGQWVGPTQDRIAALLTALDISTYPTYDDGLHVVDFGGRQRRQREFIPRINPLALLDLAVAERRLRTAISRIDLAAPWNSPDADRLDAETFDSWIRRHSRSAGGRRFLAILCRAVFAAEPADMSALWAQFYLAAGGGLGRITETAGGAQQDRIVGGSQLIAERLAQRLTGRIQTGWAVRAITGTDTDRVAVHGTDGTVRHARRVIVTVPPAVLGQIIFAPALPVERVALLQRMPHGNVVKFNMVYETPFWRRAGLSGQAFSDTRTISVVYDNTPAAGGPGVLLGFAEGRHGSVFVRLDPEDRRAAAIADLRTYFGPEAADPVAYLDHDWTADEWTRGCYGAFGTPGALTRYGRALRDPVGAVHWAGAETAVRWTGYLDGAVESGQRAAVEVTRALAMAGRAGQAGAAGPARGWGAAGPGGGVAPAPVAARS